MERVRRACLWQQMTCRTGGREDPALFLHLSQSRFLLGERGLRGYGSVPSDFLCRGVFSLSGISGPRNTLDYMSAACLSANSPDGLLRVFWLSVIGGIDRVVAPSVLLIRHPCPIPSLPDCQRPIHALDAAYSLTPRLSPAQAEIWWPNPYGVA